MGWFIRFILGLFPRKYIQRVVHYCTPIAGLLYAGRGVECPVCGRRYRKFMPYGYVVSRKNALCPGCLSLEIHRLLWLYLQNETDFFDRQLKVLHIAPERCLMKKMERMNNLDYVTADLESPLARVKMDVQDIPFGDGEFDVIFCNHILEHVDDDRKAMRELKRVLKPGGWAIMLSPINPERRETSCPYLAGTKESVRDSLWSENLTSPVLCNISHNLLNLVLFIFFLFYPRDLRGGPLSD